MINNPLNNGIKHVINQFKKLEFTIVKIIPSIIIALVLLFMTCILILLWPVGIIPMVYDLMNELISNTIDESSEKTVIEKMPFVMTFGIYLIIWIPIFILCLPFILIGKLGDILFRND